MNRHSQRRRRLYDSTSRVANYPGVIKHLETRSMMTATSLAPPSAPSAFEVRSLDGAGNNTLHSESGSTDEQLLRQSTAAYADFVSSPSGANRPRARLVSNLLSQSPADGILNNRDWSAFVPARGQFLDHDIGLTTTASPLERFPIAVPAGDPWFDPAGTGVMTIPLSRSAFDATTGLAELQKITYDEFLPALLGPPKPGTVGIAAYRGYRADVNPGIATGFSTVAVRVGHSIRGEDIDLLAGDGTAVRDPLSLRDAFFNPTPLSEVGIEPILKYFASVRGQEIDTGVVDDVRNFLLGEPGQGGFDPAAIKIQRGRDHGIGS